MCGSRDTFSRTETKFFAGGTQFEPGMLREVTEVQFARLFPTRSDGYTKKGGAKRVPLDERARWTEAKWRELYTRQAQGALDPTRKWGQAEAAEIRKVGIDSWVRAKLDELVSDQPPIGIPSQRFLVTNSSPPQAIDRIVKWEKTATPTTCGARCRMARGPMCDCICEGKFHGASVAMARKTIAKRLDRSAIAEIERIGEDYGERAFRRGVKGYREDSQAQAAFRMWSQKNAPVKTDPSGIPDNSQSTKAFVAFTNGWNRGWVDAHEWIVKNPPRFGVGDLVGWHNGARVVRGSVLRVNPYAKPEPEYVVELHDSARGAIKQNLAQSSLQRMSRARFAEGFKGFVDPWASMNPEDRREAGRLSIAALKAMPSSPRQREIRAKLNAILAKYDLDKPPEQRNKGTNMKHGNKASMARELIGSKGNKRVYLGGPDSSGKFNLYFVQVANTGVPGESPAEDLIEMKQFATEAKARSAAQKMLSARPGAKSAFSQSAAWIAKYLPALNQWWRDRTDHPTDLDASSERWEIEGVLEDVAEHCREAVPREAKPSWYAAALRDVKKIPHARSGGKSIHAAELVQKLSNGWVIEREGGILYLAKGNEAIPVPSVERALELHKASVEGRLVRRKGGFMSRKSMHALPIPTIGNPLTRTEHHDEAIAEINAAIRAGNGNEARRLFNMYAHTLNSTEKVRVWGIIRNMVGIGRGFSRMGAKSAFGLSGNELYDRVAPTIIDMNQFVTLSAPRLKASIEEAVKYAKKTEAFGEKIIREKVASPEMLRELDRMASVVKAQYAWRMSNRGSFSRPGAKSTHATDNMYYTVAAHIGDQPAGERTTKSLDEAKAYAKSMLAALKPNAKGKPLVVDVYPVVNYSPQASVLSLKASRAGAKGRFDLRAKVAQMRVMVSKLATTLGFKPDEVTGNDQMVHILFENQPKQADRLAAALRTNLARVGVPGSAITTHEHHYAEDNTTYGGVWIDLHALANASGKMSRPGTKAAFATDAEIKARSPLSRFVVEYTKLLKWDDEVMRLPQQLHFATYEAAQDWISAVERKGWFKGFGGNMEKVENATIRTLRASRAGAKAAFDVASRVNELRSKMLRYIAGGGSWDGIERAQPGLADLVGDIINGRIQPTDAMLDTVFRQLHLKAGGGFSRNGAKARFGSDTQSINNVAKRYLAKISRTRPPEGLEQFHARLKARLADIVRDTDAMLRNPQMEEDYGGWSFDDFTQEIRKVTGYSNVAQRWVSVTLGGDSLGGFARPDAKTAHAANDAVSKKIATLTREGYRRDQAVAIAHDMKRRGEI